METNKKKLGRLLNWEELKNVKGGGGGGSCYQDNTCTFPIAGGENAYGVCGTNSNSQCVCDARENYGQSVVATYCRRP